MNFKKKWLLVQTVTMIVTWVVMSLLLTSINLVPDADNFKIVVAVSISCLVTYVFLILIPALFYQEEPK